MHDLQKNAAILPNVKSITVQFVDGRLGSVRVTYDDSVRWDHIDDFVYRLSMTLGLPARWKGEGPSYSGGVLVAVREITCDGFLVRARIIQDLYSRTRSYETDLLIQNTSVPELIEERRKELEERTRETFRP